MNLNKHIQYLSIINLTKQQAVRKEQANSVSCLHVNRSLSVSFHSATADSEMKHMRNWAGTADIDTLHSLSVRKILIEGTQKTLYQNTGQDPLYLIRSSGSKHKASVCPLEHADALR